ncbi:MAG: FAD-dependent oxidoreductase [Pseudomonadota bacterium]|nr:FAD-dependent oxidoreductase [Pseudomonadota bacterium]
MSTDTVVIVGAGQAALALAEKLRTLQPDRPIIMIGEEPVLPYQRPPLSKKYMTGEMSLDRLLLRPAEWYAEHRIDCRRGVVARAIDRQAKTVSLSDGTVLAYDRLALTTGATPRRLPAAMGGDHDGVYTLRSLADADAMAHEFAPGRRMLVVGGGYIGLEAAAVAASRGLAVTLVEMAPRILQRVAAEQTSGYFRELHRRNGVDVRENVSLAGLHGDDNGRVVRAEFADGSSLGTDFVLVGIGVAPDTVLAEAAGLEIVNGILAGPDCRTSDPDIFAAGDCAAFSYRGETVRLESVQNAIEQAEAAAHAIAGEAVAYRPVPWFWSDQYDVKLQIAGLNRGYDNVVTRPGTREHALSVWYFARDAFIAVDAMNEPRAYMIGKRLLESGTPITPAQAADAAFDLKSLL